MRLKMVTACHNRIMKILVLGGTQFIGRHFVAASLARGHRVTVFTRGRTQADLPQEVERLEGDRSEGISGLSALHGDSWDACVDLSGYTPLQVRSSTELLAPFLKRYLFISTASVYALSGSQPVTEGNVLVGPAAENETTVNGDTYGPLKVTCENIVREVFGDRATVVRPQIVAGPYDHTGRHTYWVTRGPSPEPVAMPGDGTDYVQVIDARDLAGFAVRLLENDIAGTFDAAGPRITWAEFATALGITRPVWVSTQVMDRAGVDISKFPMYIPAASSQYAMFMNLTGTKALAAGLDLTPPDKTIQDTLPWSLKQLYPNAYTAEEEARLIQLENTAE